MTLPVRRFRFCNPQPLPSRSRRTSTLALRRLPHVDDRRPLQSLGRDLVTHARPRVLRFATFLDDAAAASVRTARSPPAVCRAKDPPIAGD